MTTPASSPGPAGSSGSAGCSCAEYGLAASRRSVLRGAALLGASAAVFGSTAVTMAPAHAAGAPEGSAPWVLVVLSLRGAADGLSLVVPHGDPNYYAARPRISVPKERLLAADSFFGLHPALEPLVPLWTSGRMAAVHATGLASPNRSHFAAMEEVEDAAPGSSTRSGWLNRLLGVDAYASPLQGIAVGGQPTAMVGPEPTMALNSVDGVRVAGASVYTTADPRIAALTRAWGSTSGVSGSSAMAQGMRSALGAVADFQAVKQVADPSASYPNSDLGRALAGIARTVRADIGSSVFTVDYGDWDMHTDLGSSTGGWLFNNARTLANAVAAFFADLGDLGSKVTLVTLSEFGRRTVENAERGLDHGWGNVMLLAGAGVQGGYLGTWPGLTVTGDADLSVTTDYRSVLAEVISTRTSSSTASVFPGFQPESVGVMRAG